MAWLYPVLLEVNSGPDLSLFGERLRPLGRQMLDDALRLVDALVFRTAGGTTGDAVEGAPLQRGDGPAARSAAASLAAGPPPPLARAGASLGGFDCVLARPCDDGAAELQRFKRCVSLAGSFAHSLHAAAGAPVRGVQGKQLAASARAGGETGSGARGESAPAEDRTSRWVT